MIDDLDKDTEWETPPQLLLSKGDIDFLIVWAEYGLLIANHEPEARHWIANIKRKWTERTKM